MPEWLHHLIDRLMRQCAFILCHFVVAMLFVALGAIGHHLLVMLGDPRLLDFLPWRFILDLADIPIVGTFMAMGVYEAYRVFRDDDK